MFISLKIKELLKDKKITYKELSTLTNIHEKTVANYLNDKTPMPVNALIAIAQIIEVPVYSFFEDMENGKPYFENSKIPGTVREDDAGYQKNAGNQRVKIEMLKKEIAYLKALLKSKDELIEVLKKKNG